MDQFFQFKEHNTNYRQEFMAGLTTFLAMAYILFVNTAVLSDAGMDANAVFVATALASAIGCLVMGLWAKYPIALAPGMGLNHLLPIRLSWGWVYHGKPPWRAFSFQELYFSFLQ